MRRPSPADAIDLRCHHALHRSLALTDSPGEPMHVAWVTRGLAPHNGARFVGRTTSWKRCVPRPSQRVRRRVTAVAALCAILERCVSQARAGVRRPTDAQAPGAAGGGARATVEVATEEPRLTDSATPERQLVGRRDPQRGRNGRPTHCGAVLCARTRIQRFMGGGRTGTSLCRRPSRSSATARRLSRRQSDVRSR